MIDITIDDLKRKISNIYEAVVVMSKRARQVNDEQRLQIEMEMDTKPINENRESEDFDDVEIDREALLREHKKYPKPSIEAIKEMCEGKIAFRYIEQDNKDEKK
jgi:DNA-directed RNA polymerase omega subunit